MKKIFTTISKRFVSIFRTIIPLQVPVEGIIKKDVDPNNTIENIYMTATTEYPTNPQIEEVTLMEAIVNEENIIVEVPSRFKQLLKKLRTGKKILITKINSGSVWGADTISYELADFAP